MDDTTYKNLIQELTEHRRGISDVKSVDYTRQNPDKLHNFKSVAESAGLRPEQVWLVYAQKHFDAICTYIKSNGQSESEPIKERISDLLNYGELLWGLINDDGTTKEIQDWDEYIKETQLDMFEDGTNGTYVDNTTVTNIGSDWTNTDLGDGQSLKDVADDIVKEAEKRGSDIYTAIIETRGLLDRIDE